ncbi:MAG: hypothetical protein JXQ73_12450 [Phycisphaerae bacterium]|nr:hypothetical protein [Phycisphaerae bacterium]
MCKIAQESVRSSALRMAATFAMIAAVAPAASSAAEPKATTQREEKISCRLSPRAWPESVKSEKAYAEWIDRQVALLAERVKAEPAPASRIPLLLSLANLRLARQAEPELTAMALGVQAPDDARRLKQTVDKARHDVAQAASLLRKVESAPADGKLETKQRTRWKQAAESLTALASALAGLADEKLAAPGLAGLEPLLESKQADLAATARLLRMMLLQESGQTKKALADVDPVLGPPKQLPHDFFTAMLRCRMLAQRGSDAVASALALQIDVACEKWFDKAQVPEARAAVALLRMELARRWAADLDRKGLSNHAARRRAAAERIRKDFFGKDQAGVYRLLPAVPVLIEPPPPPPPPAAKTPPSTSPAARRPSSTSTASKPSMPASPGRLVPQPKRSTTQTTSKPTTKPSPK